MRLDYGTLLSPTPIKLSIGTLRKPKLIDISELSFPIFDTYRTYINITPDIYYTQLNKKRGEICWEKLPDDVKSQFTLFDLIISEEDVRNMFLDILNFFFIEHVIFYDNVFILLKTDKKREDIVPEDISGMIEKNYFKEILEIIKQFCYIKVKDKSKEDTPIFKNDKAKELWERMQKAEKEKQDFIAKKEAENYTISNMISVVASSNVGLNMITIWDITLFQLYDQFHRIQNNNMYSIRKTQCSVWGDEKKTFDFSMFCKNIYENE